MNNPNKANGVSVQLVEWKDAGDQLQQIRQAVFIDEQQVPEELEWDGLDDRAFHLLATDPSGNPIGGARILTPGHIGRMAVIKEWRGHGVGSMLLTAAISYCRDHGCQVLRLSAQTHAIPFYSRAGFVVCSEEYLDAGIPHRDMRLS